MTAGERDGDVPVQPGTAGCSVCGGSCDLWSSSGAQPGPPTSPQAPALRPQPSRNTSLPRQVSKECPPLSGVDGSLIQCGDNSRPPGREDSERIRV